MKTRTLIGTALLLSTTGLGVAWAATQAEHPDRRAHVRHEKLDTAAAGPLRFAGNDREHGDRHHDRSRHAGHDRDNDDDDDAGARGAALWTAPADPAAAVPDNGLFQGKTRPKVEVQ
ncbi:hypothetical protein V5F53_15195 [Xanthobacter sp. V4C-4]|uniref:hypothetical protein n=1 Tax=Xanthobacter cornucopiae TaxID=3119924 RepID=UPI0037291061